VSAAVLAALGAATLAASLAILAVLALRGVLRRSFGAAVAYAGWLVVPVAALASWLPELPGATVLAAPAAMLPAIAASTSAASAPAASPASLLIAIWLAGLAGFAIVLLRRQRRYVAALALEPCDARSPVRRAHALGAGPATIGALRPWIVLPAEFERCYDAEERELVLAHERVHVARRDGLVNAVVAAVRCVLWFDPLVHLAAARLREDQELACDAAVLARHPHARRRYASAILKTQLAVPGLPVGCHWQSSHPLKERILMLKQSHPTRARRGLGAAALVLACSAALLSGPIVGVAGDEREAQAETPPSYARLTRVPYPQSAIDAKQEGIVQVRVQVAADGTVAHVEPDADSAQPAAVLQEAAVAAVKQWTFEPARRGAEPVATWVLIPITFSLTERDEPPCEDCIFDPIEVRPEPPAA
jgi:TonB family protein